MKEGGRPEPLLCKLIGGWAESTSHCLPANSVADGRLECMPTNQEELNRQADGN